MKRTLTKKESKEKCLRCGDELWQEVFGPRGEIVGYENNESFEVSGHCSYCGHILTKDD